jgi:hypothetical protein
LIYYNIETDSHGAQHCRICSNMRARRYDDLKGGAIGLFVVLPTIGLLIALAWPYVFEAGAQLTAAAEKLSVYDRSLREKWSKR